MRPITRPYSCFLAGIILCVLYGCFPHAAYAQVRIDEVAFEGLQKTRAHYLKRFIQSKAGAVYDASQVAADIQSIRNLQIFSAVRSKLEARGDRHVLIFDLEERITRLPITRFGGITDNFWLQLGLNDYNWLGQGGYFGGYYQYYDRHSFKIFSLMPYLFGNRWGLSYIVGRQATREPAYFTDTAVDFNVDRWEITGLVRYELYRNLQDQNVWTLDAGGGYLNEIYVLPDPSVLDFPARTQFDKYFLKAVLSHKRVNYYNHHLDGATQQSTFEYVVTVNQRPAFVKWLTEFRLFRHWGRANPALRILAGISSNDDTPFVPFVLDSYLNVRGSGNRVARGTAELTLNMEHRHTLLETGNWAFEGVLFWDVSAWRPSRASIREMFERENVVSFAGAGGRFHLRKIYNFSLRLDYGINTSDVGSRGFVLGVGQYF